MPKKGYKTVTLSEAIYDMLVQKYSKNKAEYLKRGITTIPGFISYLVNKEEINVPC